MIESISMPSGPVTPPLNAPQASLVTTSRGRSDLVPDDPTRLALLDMLGEPSSNASPPRVEIPPSRSVEAFHWSSLFPSAPVLVPPPLLASVSSFDETVSSPSMSPQQPIICYTDSLGAFS